MRTTSGLAEYHPAPAALKSGPAPLSVVVAAGLPLLTGAILLAHQASLLKPLFPLASVFAALVLLRSSPPAYLSLVWWLWILTPEIRRIAEAQTGWSSADPITLAPYIATAVSGLTLLQERRMLKGRVLSPLVLILSGVTLGFLAGAVIVGILPATYGLLDWLLPPLLACHIALTWRYRSSYWRTILRLSLSSSIVIGAYGVIQFFLLPSWDRLWMENAPIVSVGLPVPEKVRIFSTLNSPGVFAAVSVILILLALQRRGWLTPLALGISSVALALSLVRSAWLALIVGLLYLLLATNRRSRGAQRMVVVVVLAGGLVLIPSSPVSTIVSNRVQTIGNLSSDNSLSTRLSGYQNFAGQAFLDPIGHGLGSTGTAVKLQAPGGTLGSLSSFDSGLLDIPFTLGWLGGALYVAGVASVTRRAIRRSTQRRIAVVTGAIVVAAVAELLFFDPVTSPIGIFLFIPIGVCAAYALRFDKENPDKSNNSESHASKHDSARSRLSAQQTRSEAE